MLRIGQQPGRQRNRKRRGLTPEERLHLDVAAYLNVALQPPVFWTTIDHGAGRLSRRAAGMMKARGVKAGLPDIFVFDGRGGDVVVIGIELKSDAGKLSDDQKDTHAELKDAGVRCRVARSIEHVEDILKANGVQVSARIMAGGGFVQARAA